MAEFALGLATAFWMGVLTSLLPCPLMVNIAAISYLGARAGGTPRVLMAGLLYTAGQMLAYVALAAALVLGAQRAPVSLFLQQHGKEIVGPLLIVLAMLLLDLMPLAFSTGAWGERVRLRIAALGVWGALLLGVVLALSFCPGTAAAFFSMLPLAIRFDSPLAVPAAYGIGAALPVLAFALLAAWSVRSLGTAFQQLSRVQYWAQRITGTTLLAIGIYFALRFIFLT